MEPTGTTRRLAAILMADVAGYSRLMGSDEEATVATLGAYRGVFTSYIPKFRGRVVDAKGDALMAEFNAVSDAVGCAVSDLLYVNYTRDSTRWTRQVWYFVTIWVLIGTGIGVFSLGLNEPFWLLVTSASMNAVVMCFYNILILHMNRTRLPRALRPGIGRSLAMVWAILFFGFASLMMAYQWLA